MPIRANTTGSSSRVGSPLTSWPSMETDLRNAGANWVDEEVHEGQRAKASVG
jgi:hypothetical protein